MPARTLIIVNPASRRGAALAEFRKYEPALRSALGDYQIAWSEKRRHAEEIAATAAPRVDRILVGGGDGTMSEVAAGVLASGEAERVQLGILPMGTGGDWLRTLGVPAKFPEVIDLLARGRERRVDVGRLEHTTSDGAVRHSWFVNVASAGFSGVIAQRIDETQRRFGAAAFLAATVHAVLRNRPMRARVRVDGKLLHEGPMVLAAVANGAWFGGGMNVAPGAVPDDGHFDLVWIPGLSRSGLLTRIPKLYGGRHLDVEGVALTRGRRFSIEPEDTEAVPIEIDGEPVGRLPLEVEVVPRALRIFGVRDG